MKLDTKDRRLFGITSGNVNLPLKVENDGNEFGKLVIDGKSLDTEYLKLNQSTYQTVSGGRPNFISGIEMDISSITGDGGDNKLFLSNPANANIAVNTPSDFEVICTKITSTGNIEPAGEDPITIGANLNRWTNLYSAHTNTTGTNTLGIKAEQTRDYSWDAGSYEFELDLSEIGSTFVITNPTGYSLGLTSSVASSDKIINFPNTSGNVYVSSGTDVSVADGGTGSSSFTANGVVISAGTTTDALTSVAPATTGTFLRANMLVTPPIQWSTLILPNAATTTNLAYASATNTLGFASDLLWDATTFTIGRGAADRDFILKFNGQTNDGVLTWMEDEDYFQFSDDILLLDNEKILIGTGLDLQLYHDATNSFIYNKTGILKIHDAGSGIWIATTTSELVGFYGKAAVNQPDTIADPSGGATVDTQARTAINALIDRLQELGLIA